MPFVQPAASHQWSFAEVSLVFWGSGSLRREAQGRTQTGRRNGMTDCLLANFLSRQSEHIAMRTNDHSTDAKLSVGHWSSVRCQVLSGLYRSMFLARLSESGPRSFS